MQAACNSAGNSTFLMGRRTRHFPDTFLHVYVQSSVDRFYTLLLFCFYFQRLIEKRYKVECSVGLLGNTRCAQHSRNCCSISVNHQREETECERKRDKEGRGDRTESRVGKREEKNVARMIEKKSLHLCENSNGKRRRKRGNSLFGAFERLLPWANEDGSQMVRKVVNHRAIRYRVKLRQKRCFFFYIASWHFPTWNSYIFPTHRPFANVFKWCSSIPYKISIFAAPNWQLFIPKAPHQCETINCRRKWNANQTFSYRVMKFWKTLTSRVILWPQCSKNWLLSFVIRRKKKTIFPPCASAWTNEYIFVLCYQWYQVQKRCEMQYTRSSVNIVHRELGICRKHVHEVFHTDSTYLAISPFRISSITLYLIVSTLRDFWY